MAEDTKPKCGQCGGRIHDYEEETTIPCSACKMKLCDIFSTEGWDGEQTVLCMKCAKEAERKARGEWTDAELEAEGQLRLLPEVKDDGVG